MLFSICMEVLFARWMRSDKRHAGRGRQELLFLVLVSVAQHQMVSIGDLDACETWPGAMEHTGLFLEHQGQKGTLSHAGPLATYSHCVSVTKRGDGHLGKQSGAHNSSMARENAESRRKG